MLSIKSIPAYVLIALTIAALSAGIILLVSDRSSGSPGVEIMLPTVTPTTDSKVYVSGAVYDPGVYLMQVGDRLVDAIAAAGGATQGARLSCINLALRVDDEAHVHVPEPAEACQPPSGSETAREDVRIYLNTATAQQLEALPGIGTVKAQAIIDYRESNGPFRSIEEVMEVRGIGPAIYESIRDLISVGGMSP